MTEEELEAIERDKAFQEVAKTDAALTRSFFEMENSFLEAKLAARDAALAMPGATVSPAPAVHPHLSGTTTFTDGSIKVLDKDGNVRIRFGVWGDGETVQAIPDHTILTKQVLTMDFNNDDILKQRLFRDKAIIAMHILRVTKPQGDKGKGIGPNREDHPLFREVVHMWMNGVEITGEALEKVESARERVTKYSKQLGNSIYLGPINNHEYTRAEMLESVRHAYKEQAEAELAAALREETYGGW